MRYPVVVHNIEYAGFGAIAPDLPHCHCYADTLEGTLQKMAETIFQRLEELRQAGQPMPQAGDVDNLKKNPAFVGGVWAIIDVETT
ncbi:type II toxin-antitoxin system HicB family antitoxin [Microbulbifer sp. EKSA008]|uniref:type II toxin-antitoxin system HicB family antitoxin n=1 Tax=unclassified Microbulbifer TaxID=2619833 RepID=UPI000D52E124|nr:type II toxin-antitoxin system HicB family antitoxin [Microbulbifer sp. A4B17]AWF83058.1 HicB family protein [Microbulbifer sp. A4B17]WNZ56151.1 type II toxin-antitoxin system HicB family antitoxin [Microbulbifer sp. MKSA007]